LRQDFETHIAELGGMCQVSIFITVVGLNGTTGLICLKIAEEGTPAVTNAATTPRTKFARTRYHWPSQATSGGPDLDDVANQVTPGGYAFRSSDRR
jgi:hypothetical protein